MRRERTGGFVVTLAMDESLMRTGLAWVVGRWILLGEAFGIEPEVE